jgi:hypothetical protein
MVVQEANLFKNVSQYVFFRRLMADPALLPLKKTRPACLENLPLDKLD